MVTVKVGKTAYEIKTTLGVVKRIEDTTHKTLAQIISGVQYATVDDVVQILACGADDPAAFTAAVMSSEELGHQELLDAFMEFQYKLRYPGKTRAEAEEEELKKMLAAEEQLARIKEKMTPSS